ncbi:MAG: hypothetical protein NT031_11935 [Planctomycetota bacterium]|nr:hypothetical protein [Planctomycetota bacterium]
MKKIVATLAVTCFLASAVVLAADKASSVKKTPAEIEALIAKGLAAYKAGKNQQAIELLQQAVAAIQKAQQQGLAAFLPAAPAGWEAGKIDSGSVGAISGEDGQTYNAINLSRKYTRKGQAEDDKQTQVTITIHSQKELIAAAKSMGEMYKNPQMVAMMESSGKLKFTAIDQDGWGGWKVVNLEGSKNATATAFYGDLMLTVEVNQADAKILDQFWSAIDLKGLAGAATTKIEK